MRARQGQNETTTALSGKDRGAIEEFLAFIEDRLKDAEPVCAELVRMARLSLADPHTSQEPGQLLH